MSQAGATRRLCLGALSAGLTGAAWALPTPAPAARFPRRAVRIVVPYSVGVGPDVVVRALADRLARLWGVPVVVDNRPGASGIVAFAQLRLTPPDGHTVYLADTSTLAINPMLHARLPYDPVRDLVPLTMLFRATFALWVGEGSRFASLAALLDEARRAPGRVSYASLGHGHASHVAIESMARAADVDLLHVPFKDAGALLAAVVSAQVDFTAFSLNTVAGLVAGGRLRALAVAARERIAPLPQVPTLAQAGGPAIEMRPWAALVTRAGTPAAVLERLRRDLGHAIGTDELRRRAEVAGFELTPSAPQAVRDRVEADIALYGPLVRDGRLAEGEFGG
jgi:tripartite-type tricarboxylate transporter receptor subunit TctC